ncbi:CCR4-NOT regulatory complex component [Stygiomarasmius scandens]|uniref:CCR4-NOT regulatory complex component n=1 Tax=Marasmiellus scandens TaxID=2682957 RepID=A0ABR1JE45_9AGAR
MSSEISVSIQDLTYTHAPPGGRPLATAIPAVKDVAFSLAKGSILLLVGGNGAGKSTLLYLLAGKRMLQQGDVRVFGKDVFKDYPDNLVYLGTEWAMNAGVKRDIVVSDFLNSVGGYRHQKRRDHLLNILDVDLDWHMHAISDGERRRVQLVMGLMGEWDLLLLDEVTVDLDVLVRHELLLFLKEETAKRGATIIYATHIFDGLNDFPTHISHMRDGSFVLEPSPWPLDSSSFGTNSTKTPTLHSIALKWLSDDRALRIKEEKEGKRKKSRGARDALGVPIPTDGATFFKNYDYSH